MSDDDDRQSLKSFVSKASRASKHSKNTISDVEYGDDDNYKEKYERYKKLSKKLTTDKSSLKNKLRQLLDDVDNKAKEHQREIRESQEYLQDQINDLLEEKERLHDTLEKTKAVSIEEREKLHKNFEEKMSKYKDNLEKRYSNKDSQTVKRLEDTINKLNNERDTFRETTEKFYSEREESLHKNIADLEAQLCNMKEIAVKTHNDLQSLTKTFSSEKEQLSFQLKKEKDEEIRKLISEKDTSIMVLNNIKEQLEKRGKIADKERDDAILQAKNETEKTRQDWERKFLDFSNTYKKKVEDMKVENDGRLSEQARQHKIALEEKAEDLRIKIENITLDCSKKLENSSLNTKKQLEESEKSKKQLQDELNIVRSTFDNDTQTKLKNIEKKFTDSLEKTKAEHASVLENKEKEIASLKLRDEKIIGEMDDTNQRLKEQLAISISNTEKLQKNIQTLTAQYVANLNKSRDAFEKEVADKDTVISDLKRQISNIGTESVDKFNSLERKLKNAVEECKELQDKISGYKGSLDKAEQFILSQKTEMSKNRDTTERAIEKAKTLQLEKESIEKRFALLETDMKNKDIEMNKLKAELNRFLRTENSSKEEFQKILKENENLTLEVEKKKRELDFALNNIQQLKENYTSNRNELSETLRVRTAEFQQEKEKYTQTYSGKMNNLENLYKQSEQARENIRITNMTLTTEKEKIKNENDRLIHELEKIQKNFTEISKENSLLKVNLMNINKDSSNKDQEITELKIKASQVDSKTEQLTSMTRQYDETQSNYKHTVDNLNMEKKKDKETIDDLKQKITNYAGQAVELHNLRTTIKNLQESIKTNEKRHEEHIKKEIATISARATENEMKALQAEQRIEYVKLEFLKKLSDARQLPPEDKALFELLKKENDDLKNVLIITEKKYDKLREEYAKDSATIKVKMDFITQREEELRREAEAIKNAPPKLLDPIFKRDRDKAYASLREATLEKAKLKEDVLELTQKLQVAEGVAKNLDHEKVVIERAQKDLKESYVANLNIQQQRHTKELEDKERRIKELEGMVAGVVNANTKKFFN